MYATVNDDEFVCVAVIEPDVTGAVESIVTLVAAASVDGPVFVAVSDTPPEASVATTVPSEVQTTVTVIDEPDAALGVKAQPVAVPELLKSPETIPLTDSLNASVYESVRDDEGELGAVHVAVGEVVSITSALFAPSEPLAPGDASVSVALLGVAAPSLIVPPLRSSDEVFK